VEGRKVRHQNRAMTCVMAHFCPTLIPRSSLTYLTLDADVTNPAKTKRRQQHTRVVNTTTTWRSAPRPSESHDEASHTISRHNDGERRRRPPKPRPNKAGKHDDDLAKHSPTIRSRRPRRPPATRQPDTATTNDEDDQASHEPRGGRAGANAEVGLPTSSWAAQLRGTQHEEDDRPRIRR
jgi:hypothetical protein